VPVDHGRTPNHHQPLSNLPVRAKPRHLFEDFVTRRSLGVTTCYARACLSGVAVGLSAIGEGEPRAFWHPGLSAGPPDEPRDASGFKASDLIVSPLIPSATEPFPNAGVTAAAGEIGAWLG
jgi:hypothetical protein